MTKTKTTHTPGPWKYQCENHGDIGSRDKVTIEADNGHIALIKRITQENGRDTFGRIVKVRRNLQEVKANACLIAAAPDLLKAAEKIMAALPLDIEFKDLLDAAHKTKAAIRKARGES